MDKRAEFTDAELTTLRASFATIDRVDPARLTNFRRIFAGCSDKALAQLATAGIKFVSTLARNAQLRRNGALMAFGEAQIERLIGEGRIA